MKDFLHQVKHLYAGGEYKEALSLLEEIENGGHVCPSVLVWKARCILLADEATPYSLSDVEEMLGRAISLDDQYLPATLDLAYFYLNVLDDAERGNPLFRRALELCKEATTEAIVGAAQCIAELDSDGAALEFLSSAYTQTLDLDQIKEAREELLSSESHTT